MGLGSFLANPLGSLTNKIFGGGEQGTIWNNNGDKYQIPSLTEQANKNSGSGLDPNGVVAGIWNDLTGQTAQSREFAQQEYLQDKQNEYNLPANQMKRLSDAGINLNTAAAGIAGGSSESAQAPAVASNASGVSEGLGQAAGAAAGLMTAGSGAALAGAQTNEILSLLDFKKDEMAANISKTWIDAGMDKNMSDYWSVKAVYADRQERLDLKQKFWSIKHVRTQISDLQADIDIKKKDLEIRKQQLSQEEYKAQMLAIDKYFQDERKRIYLESGVDITLPENAMLVEAENNGTLDRIEGVFEAGTHASALGQFKAELETIQEKTRKEVMEQLFGKLQEMIVNEQVQKDLAKFGIKGNMVQRVFDYFMKYLFGTGFSVNVGKVGVTNQQP